MYNNNVLTFKKTKLFAVQRLSHQMKVKSHSLDVCCTPSLSVLCVPTCTPAPKIYFQQQSYENRDSATNSQHSS